MIPFMYVIKSIPMPESPFYTSISSALVHIWIMSDSQSSALETALAYIKCQAWEPLEIEHAFEILPEQVQGFHKDEQLLYRKALKYGIAADFVSSPIQEGNPSDPTIQMPLFRP